MKKWLKRFKRKLKYNRKANNILLFIFVMFLFMGVGYAYLNATLSITGTGKVTKTTWDVHFENIQPVTGSVSPTSAPVISNDTTVSFSATLNEPGDFYSFDIDLVNAGTIDASIGSLDITPVLTSEQQEYFEYKIKYKGDSGLDVSEGDALSHGDTKTIEILFRYKELDNHDLYPDEDVVFNFVVSVNSMQASFNKEESVMRASSNSDTYAYKSATYKNNIKKIMLDDHINPPSGYIESWDVSEGSNGNVMAYLTVNSEDNTMYDLYIQGNGHLYAPEDSSYLFGRMENVEYINNLTILDTSNVTNMRYMFAGVRSSGYSGIYTNIEIKGKIKSLDLSNFDTSNVTNMQGMFENQCSLTSLDLSNFDTSNVTNMGEMFEDTGRIEILDLSSFDTRNVTLTNCMFRFSGPYDAHDPVLADHLANSESQLRTIYVSNLWDVSYVPAGNGNASSGSTWMFDGCNNIVGGNGTTYHMDSSQYISDFTDKTYAVVDTPSTPGYLTLKQ